MRSIKVTGKIHDDGRSTIAITAADGSPVEVDPHSVLTNALRIGHARDMLEGSSSFDYPFPITL